MIERRVIIKGIASRRRLVEIRHDENKYEPVKVLIRSPMQGVSKSTFATIVDEVTKALEGRYAGVQFGELK